MNNDVMRKIAPKISITLFRVSAGLILIAVCVIVIVVVSSDKEYWGGRLVLDETGVLIVRILMVAIMIPFVIICYSHLKCLFEGWIVRFTTKFMEINTIYGVKTVKYETINSIIMRDKKDKPMKEEGIFDDSRVYSLVVKHNGGGDLNNSITINVANVGFGYQKLRNVLSSYIGQTVID